MHRDAEANTNRGTSTTAPSGATMTDSPSELSDTLATGFAFALHERYRVLLERLAVQEPARAAAAMADHRGNPAGAAGICWSLMDEVCAGAPSDHAAELIEALHAVDQAWRMLFELSEPHWRFAVASLGPAHRANALAVLQAQIWRFDPWSDVSLSAHVAWRMVPALNAAMASM